MLRINRLLPMLVCLLLGGSGCVSTIRVDPENRRLALQASNQGDWAQAMERWNGVLLERRGRDPEARLHLGEALLAAGQGLAAIQVLRAEAPAKGTELPFGLLLARAHFSQDQVRAGTQVLSGLMADHAGNLQVLTLYGRALLGGDREAKGLGLLLQALRVEAGDGALAEEVARRAHALNLADMEGQAWTLRLQAPAPPADAFVGSALWELSKAEGDGAEVSPGVLTSLQRAVELDPLNGTVWTLLAGLHVAAGRDVEARQAYRRAVEVDPGDWGACLALAKIFVAMGECAEAKTWIQHGLAGLSDESLRAEFEELQSACE